MAKTDAASRSAGIRKRDAERTRAVLLKAGLKEFAVNGFSGGRLERVVKAAGCNIRMVYHYYGGKAGLYLAVLEAAADLMRDEEAELDLDLDRPLAGMLELMRFSYEFFERHPLVEALLRTENMNAGKQTARLSPMVKGQQARLQLIEALVASGKAKGLFRDDLDPLQVHTTVAALSRFRLSVNPAAPAGLSKARASSEQRLQHCLAFLEAGLLDTGVKKRLVRDPAPVGFNRPMARRGLRSTPQGLPH